MQILDISYEKYFLPNGLQVIIHKNNSLPIVSVNIWYRVGSANEKTGKTGLAHLFEHMMFQGSENVAKELHFKYIQEAGGTLNGSTSFDRTNYFEKLPSNELELALWLESDRMSTMIDSLDQVKLDNQKSVVYNERLERYDNQPYGLAWEILLKNLYPEGHPYSWPTIGFLNDIKNYELNDVKDFSRKYYSPGNASLVVAGDLGIDPAKRLIEKYFGGIKSSGSAEELIVDNLNSLTAKEIVHEDNVQLERLYLAWHSEPAFGEYDAALDILSDILGGSKNSRLQKKLIYELEIAQDVSAMQFSGKYAGHFMIVATAKPGKSSDEISKVIINEIDSVISKGITHRELQRSINGIKSGFIYSLQNLDTLADQLNLYNFYLGKPDSFNYDLERYSSVDEKDISKAAEKYLNSHRIQFKVVPRGKGGN